MQAVLDIAYLRMQENEKRYTNMHINRKCYFELADVYKDSANDVPFRITEYDISNFML